VTGVRPVVLHDLCSGFRCRMGEHEVFFR
jgi:hypothetical protein